MHGLLLSVTILAVLVVTVPVAFAIIFILFMGRPQHSAHGTYSLDATGQIEGHFSGQASSGYPPSYSDADRIFKVDMNLTRAPLPEASRAALYFSFATLPTTGVYRLTGEQFIPGAGPAPPIQAGFIASMPGVTFVWEGVNGELRLETDARGGTGLRGEFSVDFVQELGGPRTNTMRVVGQFQTR